MSSFIETYTARLAEVGKLRDAILAASQPLRDQYTALSQDTDQKLADLAVQIKAAETGLADLTAEHGMIVRALSANDITMAG